MYENQGVVTTDLYPLLIHPMLFDRPTENVSKDFGLLSVGPCTITRTMIWLDTGTDEPLMADFETLVGILISLENTTPLASVVALVDDELTRYLWSSKVIDINPWGAFYRGPQYENFLREIQSLGQRYLANTKE